MHVPVLTLCVGGVRAGGLLFLAFHFTRFQGSSTMCVS